jgi:hypothetical protein
VAVVEVVLVALEVLGVLPAERVVVDLAEGAVVLVVGQKEEVLEVTEGLAVVLAVSAAIHLGELLKEPQGHYVGFPQFVEDLLRVDDPLTALDGQISLQKVDDEMVERLAHPRRR